MHVAAMKELRQRGVIRSENNPVGDYGEYLVAKKLRLQLVENSTAHFDAIDPKTGLKYQIKSRRSTALHNRERNLGVIRSLNKADFDFVVAVLFDDYFRVIEIYKIPKSVVKKFAKYSKHQNGHILSLRGEILQDKKVIKLLH